MTGQLYHNLNVLVHTYLLLKIAGLVSHQDEVVLKIEQ